MWWYFPPLPFVVFVVLCTPEISIYCLIHRSSVFHWRLYKLNESIYALEFYFLWSLRLANRTIKVKKMTPKQVLKLKLKVFKISSLFRKSFDILFFVTALKNLLEITWLAILHLRVYNFSCVSSSQEWGKFSELSRSFYEHFVLSAQNVE